jgi:sulfatase modifying factor 1
MIQKRFLRALMMVPMLGLVGCSSVPGSADDQNGEGSDASLADAAVDVAEDVAPDSGARDSMAADTADADVSDAFAVDTMVRDTSAADTSAADTSVADTSAADTSAADTSAADTWVADTSPTDTRVADTLASDAGPCVAGGACATNPNGCKTGKTSCTTGSAVCVDDTPKSAGTACPEGTCDGAGACKCVEGSKRCKSGAANTPQRCTGGAWVDATACSGAAPTCSAGSCVATPVAASCALSGPGRSDCGASGTASCCESLLVTGVTTATFSRSYDNVTYTDPQYKAQVSDLRLDKYEITVGRFRRYVAAVVAGWKPAAGAGKHTHLNGGGGLNAGTEPGWDAAWNTTTNFPTSSATWDTNLSCNATYQTWTSTAGTNETKPINCLSWYDAAAFCIWDGGFLPSEAEWNYAASGGMDQRVYPWSSPSTSTTIDATYAVYAGTSALAVGSKPKGDGKYGQSDLAGNVWEWVLDWNKSPYNETICSNCAYLTATSNRVIRGGGRASAASGLLAGYRSVSVAPAARGDGVGARCARIP